MPEYLSPEQVSELIPGVTKPLLAQWRYMGTGPAFIRVSPRKIVYSRQSIEDYLRSRERTSTAEPVPA